MSKNYQYNFQNSKESDSKNSLSWKKAWMLSPGPRTVVEYRNLFFKGICMGTADIVPGVSGGTIAFITGIYESFLSAISSINAKFLLNIVKLNFKKALSEFHSRFLIILFLGIVFAIITTANLMHFFLIKYPIQIWSIFFGLISASILILSQSIKKRFLTLPILILGTAISYLVTSIIPINTPEYPLFIFFCGMISICAMILPGLSGSYILLILGKYAFITSALRNPFLIENMEIILIFSSGCLIGIVLFAKILRYGILYWHDYTMAFLTGIMLGSMKKVWPWKITLESQIVGGKEYVLKEENVWPYLNFEFLVSVLLMCFGFSIVFILEKFSKSHSKKL